MKLQLIKTPDNGERIKTLKVTGVKKDKMPLPYEPNVLFSVKLTDVKKGDIIDVKSYAELTNDLGFNVMLGYYIAIADAPTWQPTKQIELTEAKGYNITPAMHHGSFTDVGHYEFTQDYCEVYINQIVYAASTLAKPTHTLEVEQDYGRLSVLHFRIGL